MCSQKYANYNEIIGQNKIILNCTVIEKIILSQKKNLTRMSGGQCSAQNCMYRAYR